MGNSNKNIKFISVNVSVMALLAVVLSCHFTTVGLISWLVGSTLLFLGTLFDNKKANNAVSCKLGFIIFMTTLILFGMWLPFVIKAGFKYIGVPEPGIAGTIIFTVISLTLFVMASSQKFKSYFVLTRCLRYSGQLTLFLAAFYLWNIPRVSFWCVAACVVAFLLTDLFATSYEKHSNPDFADKNKDMGYWMAFLINLCFFGMNLFCQDYFIKCVSPDAVKNGLLLITSGFNVPLFILLMVALSAVFIYLQSKSDNYRELSDSYLTLSLGGFALLFRVFESNFSAVSAAILCVAVLLYFIFGFSIPSAGFGSGTNPVYRLIRFRDIRESVDAVSVLITVLSLPAMILANAGYIPTIAVLICSAAVIAVSFARLRENNTMKNIRWQIVLLCVLGLALSVAFTNRRVEASLVFLISQFAVASLAVWTLGVRQDATVFKYREPAQGAVCALSCAVGILAAAATG